MEHVLTLTRLTLTRLTWARLIWTRMCVDVPAGWAKIARIWWRRARTRRQLRDLDDRLLADAGITRDQAREEAAKPFWKP